MAELLDVNVKLSDGGYATPEFEDYWSEALQLTASNLPELDSDLRITMSGRPTPYFESAWNELAVDLGKESLDVDVPMVDDDGNPTLQFEDAWSDLIT